MLQELSSGSCMNLFLLAFFSRLSNNHLISGKLIKIVIMKKIRKYFNQTVPVNSNNNKQFSTLSTNPMGGYST
jgi:hypothetical protein